MSASAHNLVLLGAPGSGKGTQSKRLVKTYGIPQISMGDILRQKRSEASTLGKQLDDIMRSGALVPDEVVIDIINDRLQQSDTDGGFILDGFPRTVGQADALDHLLERIGKPITSVVFLDVDETALLDRLTNRRVCENCGHEYNLKFAPPETSGVCDQCGGNLIQRADDNEETIRERQSVFREKTSPLIEYYTRKKTLVRISGDSSLDEVFDLIQKTIG